MIKIVATTACLSLKIVIERIGLLALLLVLILGTASAQTTALDKGSSPGLAPGAPAGSYALSDLDTINPYNGNLNFHLPLLQIGGRGAAQMGMVMSLDTNYWVVEHKSSPDIECTGGGCPPATYNSPKDSRDFLARIAPPPGYGPGTLRVQHLGIGSWGCDLPSLPQQPKHYETTLTRLIFVAPDGTEYEMRDQLTNGQPQSSNFHCDDPDGPGFNRGTIFVSTDGTSATFISTDASGNPTPIHDFNFAGSQQSIAPVNGYLILRDGTRYWIESTTDYKSIPLIRWMRDRNGNLIRFDYYTDLSNPFSYGHVSRITDSLDREVTFAYTQTQDTITYKGFGGGARTIRIIKTPLSEALHADYQSQGARTYGYLFPELSGLYDPQSEGPDTLYNPVVNKSVILPDGRSYELRYNPYGGIARVEVPTGGAIEYDYTSGSGLIFDGGEEYNIWRQVVERRVYPDGVTLKGKMTYSYETTGGYENPITVATIKHCQGNSPLAIEKHYYKGDPQTFNDASRTPVSYAAFDEGREFKTEWLDKDSPGTLEHPDIVLRRVEQTWENREHVSWWMGPGAEPPNDPRVTKTVTTLMDASPYRVTQRTFEYDDYNNQTDVNEYDYGDGQAGPRLRHTHTDYLVINSAQGNKNYAAVALTGGVPNLAVTVHIRNLPVEQQVFQVTGSSEVEQARTTYEYDKYDSSANHAELVPRSAITGHDADYSTVYKTRGNVTAVSRWLKDKDKNINAYQQYDVLGNVVKAFDPRGATATTKYWTSFDYTDNFGTPDGNAHNGTSENTYAFPTLVTNPQGYTVYTQYEYNLGKAVDVEDANGVVNSTYYSGALDRPSKVIRDANGVVATSQTLFTYLDADHIIRTTTDLTATAKQKSEVVYDGLGRTIETRAFETGTNYICVQQTYDALGRVSQQTNPYRSSTTLGSAPATGEVKVWTITTYDDLGRVTQVKTPDNAKVTTGYNNDVVTVEDQTGRDRESTTDALGRLVKVVEDPAGLNYSTTYTYDAVDNLLKVKQGSQERNFTYDSLSRLESAENPESGLLTYDYDDNGNLLEKKDARLNQSNAQVTITYSYDKLNRLTSKSYNDGTPNVSYFYDAVPSSGVPTGFIPNVTKGQLVAMTYGTGGNGTYYGHDALGRVTQSVQKTDGISYAMTYGYDLANNLISEGYPSGRVVKTTYDLAGRLSSVTGVKESRTTSYASQFYYASHGAVSKLRLGNGLWEHTSFNTRLQPVEIGLGISATDSGVWKLAYKYGELVNGVVQTTRNNGNVASQTVSVPKIGSIPALTLTQTYTYDELNRIETAQEKKGSTLQWQQTFKYDRYGNRTFDTTSGQTTPGFEGLNPSISTVNNRISKSGYSYDAVGNMTLDELDHTYQYDAENHLKSYDGGVGAAYTYDGEGHRVKKVTGNGTLSTIYVYDAEGKLIAEYATNTGSSEVGTRYLTQDALGSTRVVTTTSSTAPTALSAPSLVTSRSDYLPFGEEIKVGVGGRVQGQGYLYGSGVVDNTRQKFTGYERDNETGLDYAQARYYASTQGRFISPDNFLNDTHVSDPQSWNLYAYVRNNPLNRVDPSGEKGEITSTYDAATNTTTIKIKASFALYGAAGQNVSQADLQKYAAALKSGIEKYYNKELTIGDRNYKMSVDVSVQVAGSEKAAIAAGVDNIVEIGNASLQQLQFGKNPSDAYAVSYGVKGENFDRMAFDISRPGANPEEIFAHEFGHLLGVTHTSMLNSLFNTYLSGNEEITPEAFQHMFFAPREDNIELLPPNTFYYRSPSRVLTSTSPTFELRRAHSVYNDTASAYRWSQQVKQ